jgi:predicted nucleotidyltransferase
MLTHNKIDAYQDAGFTASTGTESLHCMPENGSQRVRLCGDEYRALVFALQGVKGRAFIFGSRTRLDKRGGDIDLLVETNTESVYRVAQDITVRFRMNCDEKIDVLIVDPNRVNPDVRNFYMAIREEAVPIYEGG